MAQAKLVGSRKDNGTPRRFKTLSFFWPAVETEQLDDQDDDEEEVVLRGVDQDEEEEGVGGVCGVEASALKKAFNWSGQSQESARLTWPGFSSFKRHRPHLF